MPKQYEDMRDSFIRQGMKTKAAKSKAARIYNSKNPGAPVTGRPEGGDNRNNRDKRDNRGFGD